jgi:hypothetical protein
MIGLICLVAFFWSLSFNMIRNGLDKEKKEYTVNMGKKVVIANDTLTVTDYSTIYETYTLSNGSTVSKYIVENQLNNK